MKWDFSDECDKNVNDNANPCLACIHYSSLGCQAKKEKKGDKEVIYYRSAIQSANSCSG